MPRVVYVLESLSSPTHHYVGSSSDVTRRLEAHNSGASRHTAKYRPWRVVVSIEFADATGADRFERYLKSGSGHAFARKRLW